jgi:hypothetical protein
VGEWRRIQRATARPHCWPREQALYSAKDWWDFGGLSSGKVGKIGQAWGIPTLAHCVFWELLGNKGLKLAPHGIDNIGCYWFYCNASNEFGQKCLLCTTDLSHVTDL